MRSSGEIPAIWRSEPAPIQTRSWTRSSPAISTCETPDAGKGATPPGSKPVAARTSSGRATRAYRVRAAVADEDEGLDDLRTRGADGLGRGAGGRRSLWELLDPRVDAGPLDHLCDPRHRLRPALHEGNVSRRNRAAPLAVQTPGDDNVERETMVNEHERRALNEALFRDVNERIAESAENVEADKTEFVCECADSSCTERVPATLAEYESVRKKSTTFLLAPGHHEPDIEQVVADRGRFQIVEKMQEVVRRAVIRLDPRTRPRPSE